MKSKLGLIIFVGFITVVFLSHISCDKNSAKSKNSQDGIIVEMADGSKVRINGKDTLKKWGTTNKQLNALSDHPIIVKRCFSISKSDLPSELQNTYPNSEFIGVDTLFATHPQPLDPDEVAIKDMDGERVLAELVGRVHLNPKTGEAIKDMSGDVIPEFLRELLVFRLKDHFKKALLYVEMKPRATVSVGKAPAHTPNMKVMIKPMKPEDSKIKPPKTEKDTIIKQKTPNDIK